MCVYKEVIKMAYGCIYFLKSSHFPNIERLLGYKTNDHLKNVILDLLTGCGIVINKTFSKLIRFKTYIIDIFYLTLTKKNK